MQCTPFRLHKWDSSFLLHGWPHSNPAYFIYSKGLHHWYWFYWDHNVVWCKNALSLQKLDFHYSILHPIIGMYHFKGNITTLKQVTGQAQHDIQHYLVAVIAGAAPSNIVTVIYVLMDFWYLAQAMMIMSLICNKISFALSKFHDYKHTITNEGLQRGAKSGTTLLHWKFPKLELLHSVAASTSQLGVPVQWSADTTEHAHIEVVKQPTSMTNNQGYDSQICYYLNRREKCWLFQIETGLTSATAHSRVDNDLDSILDAAKDVDPHEGDNDYPSKVLNNLWSSSHSLSNLFATTEALWSASTGSVLHPLHTFTFGHTTFCLNYNASIKHIPIENVTEMFNLPDLWPALADFLNCDGVHLHSFGGQRCSPLNAHLLFNDLQVWYKVHIQQKLYHNPTFHASVFTINAWPSNCMWEYSCYDAVILQVDG